MRVLEPGLYQKQTLYNNEENKAVSLKGIRLDIEMRDIAAKTTMTQVYINEENVDIEAVYCFPVDESAAVYGFEIETEGRTITGKIEEREKAFEIYDKAIQSGDGSFLLDQELQDILVISAGNIKPGQEVKITVKSVSKLPVTDNVLRLQIPTTVSPRYAPADEDLLKADRISPPYQHDVPYTLEIFVKVLSEPIAAINSPSHEICINEEGKYQIISLKNKTTHLDRDFILECEIKKEQEAVCILTTHENRNKALMFRFFPQFDKIPEKTGQKSEVIFILDCSGSMQGSSIEEAKAALDLSLRSLNEGDLFQIIRFGSSWTAYSKEPVLYGEKTLKKALSFINSISADMGGTELREPVSYVCGLPKIGGYTRDVILLTDGEVSNPDEVIHEVHKASDKLRVFSFGIGYGASHHLVKGIARASGGAYEMIQPGEKIQPKVLRQFSRISQPFFTDLSIELKGGELDIIQKLPPLFEGDDYTVFAKILNLHQEKCEIVCKGNYLDSSYSWKAPVNIGENDNTIPTLWALSRVKQIKEENIGGSSQMDRKRKNAEKMITDIGLDFSILTEYTSFVAVEKRDEDKKAGGQPEYRRIPVHLTKDWHGTGSGSGAVNLQLSQAGDMLCAPKRGPRMFKPSLFGNLLGGGGFSGMKKKSEKYTAKVNKTPGKKDIASEPEKTDPVEWYLELLGTQQADGRFTGKEIVEKYFKLTDKEFNSMLSKTDVPAGGLAEKALITWLAVKALTGDPDVHSVSRRAVKKAEKWLSKNAPEIRIAGESVGEYMKVYHHIV